MFRALPWQKPRPRVVEDAPHCPSKVSPESGAAINEVVDAARARLAGETTAAAAPLEHVDEEPVEDLVDADPTDDLTVDEDLDGGRWLDREQRRDRAVVRTPREPEPEPEPLEDDELDEEDLDAPTEKDDELLPVVNLLRKGHHLDRSKRSREVRARSLSATTRVSRRALAAAAAMYPEDTASMRPRTRGECVDGPRPCPWVSCRHHLYLDVDARTGALKVNFPDLEPEQLAQSCSLDLAERDGMTLEEVGQVLNLTRERVRQIENRAGERIEKAKAGKALKEHAA